jgi:hypothetical protein
VASTTEPGSAAGWANHPTATRGRNARPVMDRSYIKGRAMSAAAAVSSGPHDLGDLFAGRSLAR